LISALPKNNTYYPSILDGYIQMMDALLSYQTEGGMWRQLVDKPESWVETSATAMFGYAIALGVKNGLLNNKKYAESYQKAWLALAKYINSQGQITDVCVGTGQSEDINYYLSRPKIIGDLHGQAPMLWFAYSLLL
jgi:rhamnogalacturonyl hydrolase YesR